MKNKNVPELRFPEFHGDGEWEEKKLNEVFTLSAGGDVDKECFSANKDSKHPYPIYGNALTNEGLYGYSSRYKVSSEAITITGRGDIGKIFYREKFFTPIVRLVTGVAKEGFSTKFLSYACSKIRFSLETTGVPQLTVPQVKKYSTFVALDEEEQQKIANCLSSLDDIIHAQAQKLEKLTAHKKGLLQKLFPEEGQKVPEFRFPEFRGCGEWEKVKFSKYIKLYRGSSPRPIAHFLTTSPTGVNWIKIGDTKHTKNNIISFVEEKISYEGSLKSRKVEIGELILANSMSYGKTYQLAIEGCIYDGWFVLREYENSFYKPFLLQLLNSDYMQKQYTKLSAGGIVQNISSEIVYETNLFDISIPEQQKIADCLSSLDSLILQHTKKLDALKRHKQGLMQGLFPRG